MLLDLPAEILLIIFDLLSDEDKLHLHMTCKTLYSIPVVLKGYYNSEILGSIRNPNIIIQNVNVYGGANVGSLQRYAGTIKNIRMVGNPGRSICDFIKMHKINVVLTVAFNNPEETLSLLDTVTSIRLLCAHRQINTFTNKIKKLMYIQDGGRFTLSTYLNMVDLEFINVFCSEAIFVPAHTLEKLSTLKLNVSSIENIESLATMPRLKKLTIGSTYYNEFGFSFNANIDSLPDTIEELNIASGKFCQEIKRLPAGLKRLTIKGDFVNFDRKTLPCLMQLDVMEIYAETYGDVISECLLNRKKYNV